MKDLNWGETPWDNLSKEELLLVVKKMYSALISSESILNMSKVGNENHPFWSKGSGGKALEKTKQVIKPIHEEYTSENIYRSYFRYANDLLFNCGEFDLGFGWVVCSECGQMVGKQIDDMENIHIGKKCSEVMFDKNCNGTLRKIKWEDLEPIKR